MRTTKVLFFALVCFSFLTMGNVALAHTPDFVDLAAQLKPSVVNISTSKNISGQRPNFQERDGSRDLFEEFFRRFAPNQPQRPRKQSSLGSGFIISDDGYILTNDHVVNGADEVTVRLADGRSFDATIRGSDAKLDLALLKIDTGEKLPVAKLGNSDSLRVGEWVMAIGNPFGLEQTVTTGIVSAKGRVIGAGPYDDFIQTDASINPGNSGGPLYNMQGEVVGINTAIIRGGQGIGFALPINAARVTIEQLKETGEVVRGWLGVSIQKISDELAESFGLAQVSGALVAEVIEGSPAADAGIRRGDIILEFNGQEVDEMNDLPRIVAATPVDKSVEVKLFRDGKEVTVKVKVGKLAGDGRTAHGVTELEERMGLSLTPLGDETSDRYGLDLQSGLLVSAVDPDGPAADSNLRPGDVIVEVNGKEIDGLGQLRTIVAPIAPGKVLRILVQRGASSLYTTLKLN
ncbi:MAG TPA: DegQ family serine endoprotease [Geopsychrobacteraceae bacterium]|nr:DegQ family serine endoprotease [Geopsychrobacteraceae bacterium]